MTSSDVLVWLGLSYVVVTLLRPVVRWGLWPARWSR